MSGALDGVVVIDFGQYIAGPMTGMLLADQGADVIKVDPVDGPRWHSPGNATWNRGKRSIQLDLKSSADLATARRLIANADVVVENFRPGVMDRLGLGFDTCRVANKGLVYCSLPGFAADDPRATVAAWEGVVGAATATYRVNPETRRPVYTPIPIASTFAALQGAVSIVMALIAREKDGQGQRVEVPLFDGMFTAMGSARLRDRPTPPGPGAASPWTRQFQCKDGRWVQFHAINLGFKSFVDAVGASAWAYGPSPERMVEELFRTRTAAEWEEFAESVGTECVVCRTSDEWLRTPQAQASNVVTVEDPNYG
ncbi:MAG TPA: CoA transferase, partial [Dehalococcoidia bacterium]